MPHSDRYIPALSHDLLTPLYDPLIRLFMREKTFKRKLIDQAGIRGGQRVLRPSGELHVVDFGPPRTLYSRPLALVTARSEEVSVNVKGRLPGMFREAGFERVAETGQFGTVAGPLSFYRAHKS